MSFFLAGFGAGFGARFAAFLLHPMRMHSSFLINNILSVYGLTSVGMGSMCAAYSVVVGRAHRTKRRKTSAVLFSTALTHRPILYFVTVLQ